MDNQNYYNYYVETLTSTMTDAVLRNVSLQASVRVGEDNIKEYEKTIELLDAEIGKLNEQLENEINSRKLSENQRIQELEIKVNSLNSELNEIRNLREEYDNIKHQVLHVETFRSELMKSRKECENLKKQIEYLQLTPAKRKKVDELNASKEQINTKDQIKDGGTF